jgi:RNA-directed DNA polymerase
MSIVVKIIGKQKPKGAKGHYCKQSFTNTNQIKLIVMNHKNIGASGLQTELFKKRRSEYPDAERVKMLQEKLYQKAKQERSYKFYVLYDKMFIPYMLREAWKSVRHNGGVPGVDGVKIADVEQYGVEKYLEELGEDLRRQTYKPQAVKRVMIDKANGGQRPLGIPTVRDRIAQTVCKMVIEPIFEADFEESSYGFRPKRSSKDALRAIKGNLNAGKAEVYDVDLASYFDTIPHSKLQAVLKVRISDPRILKLINKWLKVPTEEKGIYKSGKRNNNGVPQGGVISPLLSNIYLHLIDRIVNNANSLFGKSGVNIVRYADDFVLMGKALPNEIVNKLQSLIKRMGLQINENKSRKIDAKKESFNFLGFTIRYDKDIKGRDCRYWNITPSKKSEMKVRGKIREYLSKHGHSKAQEIADELNAIIRGWINYYEIQGVCYPAMSKRRLRYYLCAKLHQYYNRKSQRKCRLYGQDAFGALVVKFGLIDPTKYTLTARL